MDKIKPILKNWLDELDTFEFPDYEKFPDIELYMDQVIKAIFLIVLGIIGGLPTAFLVVAFPSVIVWKIYRCIRYGYKITD